MEMTDHDESQRPDWRKWRSWFASRAFRQLPDPFAHEPQLATVPKSVARSLAIFQLGESGGGTIVEEVRNSRLEAIDDAYADAMALFVDEEHHHAELLACGVRMLGGELIRKNWTARLFVFGRRLMGLRVKVTVLLVAEVVGICYYHLLASRLPPSQLRSMLNKLVEDELSHLDFHCTFLRTQTATPLRLALFRIGWRMLSRVAAAVVLLDHRKALRELGISRRTAWRRWISFSRHAENVVSCRMPEAGSIRYVASN
jgi:hypothetical protein